MRAGVRKGGMRVAPVARLSQLGCLCLTTWIVVTMRVRDVIRDVGDAQGGLAR